VNIASKTTYVRGNDIHAVVAPQRGMTTQDDTGWVAWLPIRSQHHVTPFTMTNRRLENPVLAS
jgi:hypothetical protein